LPKQLEHFEQHGGIASFLCCKPNLSYHSVAADAKGVVTGFHDIVESGVRVNGGFFVFRQEIFDYLREGEELVLQPFQRLLAERKLLAYNYDGFWMAVDTAKEKQRVDELFASGNPPWQIWQTGLKTGRKG